MQLSGHLTARSAGINENGQARDINSGAVFSSESIDSSRNSDEKLRQAECVVIAKQVSNYADMEKAQVGIQLAKSDLAGASDSVAIAATEARLKENAEKYAACEKLERDLVHEREGLSFVDAVNTVDDGRFIDIEEVVEHSEKRTKMDEYKEEISTRKENSVPVKGTEATEKIKASFSKDER